MVFQSNGIQNKLYLKINGISSSNSISNSKGISTVMVY